MTRTLPRWFTAVLLVLLLAGVAADCGGEGGTYQGGNDSVPYHRR